MGHTTAEVAATVGVHRATVFRWRKGSAYRARVASISQDSQRVARTTLQAGARKASRRLTELMDHDDPRVALRAALAVLDRAGHGPAQRIDLTAVQQYPQEELEDASEELRRLLVGMEPVAR